MSGHAVSGRAVSGRAVSGRAVSGRAVSGHAAVPSTIKRRLGRKLVSSSYRIIAVTLIKSNRYLLCFDEAR